VGRATNFLEAWYPWPSQIQALAEKPLPGFEARYPKVRLHVGDGCALPFDDRSFDIVFSNAVIEHVGDSARQRRFLAELCRVSDRVFISTPARSFPVELHTLVPFAHWLPMSARNAIYRWMGRPYWASESRLRLMGERELLACVPAGWRIELKRQRLAGLTVNLNLLLYREKKS
jgi:SAM-dependent methyltransferase